MGTGFSIDTPIRVGHLGIDSVISIVDDLLVERIRKQYCAEYGLDFHSISRNADDGRARRIAAYLDVVQEIVTRKFDDIRNASLAYSDEKRRYFELMEDSHPLKALYLRFTSLSDESEKQALEADLTAAMRPGSIDVNIMSKVDRLDPANELSDAVAALKGFVMSKVEAAVVLSAGFNPRLYSALASFQNLYRDESGKLKKRIILKVSDYRSALIQGKFLAKKGLEVSEFRVESGLNCGGHAFYSDGKLLPSILKEFREQRDQLKSELQPMIESFYATMGWAYNADGSDTAEITVQGGIGTDGERKRLLDEYRIARTGWGSPFLVVPEATNVDKETLNQLIQADEEDLYLSQASPLGVPFNNLRHSGSQEWHAIQSDKGKPGSPCPKGFLKSNTEFTTEAICTASSEYMGLKLQQIEESSEPESVKAKQRAGVLAKECLCVHLGNASLINLGIIKESQGPQAICPGPNLAWFKGPYSLNRMIDHIYGRGESLVPSERPHMFAKEITMNIDYLETLVDNRNPDDKKQAQYLENVIRNLQEGIDRCKELTSRQAFPNENLDSLAVVAVEQEARLERIHNLIAIPVA
jgi:hypothetical protein